MIVAKDQSWCILTPPKTASTTLRDLFADARFEATLHADQHWMEPPPGAKVFLSVRDPWTRTVSLWRHRLHEMLNAREPTVTFKEYMALVKQEALIPFFSYSIHRLLAGIEPDAVIRFETLVADLRQAFPQHNWDTIRVPHSNRNPVITQNHPLRNFHWARQITLVNDPLVDPEARQLVLDWCPEDFARFGYSTEYHDGSVPAH